MEVEHSNAGFGGAIVLGGEDGRIGIVKPCGGLACVMRSKN